MRSVDEHDNDQDVFCNNSLALLSHPVLKFLSLEEKYLGWYTSEIIKILLQGIQNERSCLIPWQSESSDSTCFKSPYLIRFTSLLFISEIDMKICLD